MQSVYLRFSIHDGCNLRCTYCRPEKDIRVSPGRQGLSTLQLVELISLVQETIPIRKLRLTGGEPLLREDALDVVRQVREILPDVELCMTTNGTFLKRLAPQLKEAGLDRLNVSLDTVDAGVYSALTRGGVLHEVVDGIRAAMDAGFDGLKLNAVLLRSLGKQRLLDLVMFAAKLGVELRFIELMPISVAAGMHRMEFLDYSDTLSYLEQEFGAVRALASTGIAKRYKVPVGTGSAVVGFVSSVTEPFCSTCDRLRVDSRGRMFACLRNPDWLDLGTPLKDGDTQEVKIRIKAVLDAKREPDSIWPGRQMSAIGG